MRRHHLVREFAGHEVSIDGVDYSIMKEDDGDSARRVLEMLDDDAVV